MEVLAHVFVLEVFFRKYYEMSLGLQVIDSTFLKKEHARCHSGYFLDKK